LTTDGLHLQAGTLSITLNDHFVDALEAPKEDVMMEFPCSYLQAGENKVAFANARFQEQFKLDENFQVILELSDGSQEFLSNRRLIHDDMGSLYRISFKWIF
jgi:hypothetical protein